MDVSARRIALIKPSALGDIVHALPVLTALREKWPAADITWIVNTSYESLLLGHPDLTDTLAFNRGAARRGPLHAARYAVSFARQLRRRRFDLVIDLQGLFRSALMCLATGAKTRIGFDNAREGSRFTYTHRVPIGDATHAVDRYWKVAEFLGVGNRPKHFKVPIAAEARAWAAAELHGLPRPIVAVAPGSKWITKRWPPAHFARVLARTPGVGSAVFVGTGEDTALSHEVMSGLYSPARDLTGKTTLPQLAGLLQSVDVMLGNDTGPLHLAAALGTPCVAPYTCTKVARHGPYNSFAGAVETAVACGGSYLKTCPAMICMADLTPERLAPRLTEVLTTWAARSRSA
jgi:lipopolysaccharide heptosyltransferase I